eukprot:851525-Rhodomonas_salina.2
MSQIRANFGAQRLSLVGPLVLFAVQLVVRGFERKNAKPQRFSAGFLKALSPVHVLHQTPAMPKNKGTVYCLALSPHAQHVDALYSLCCCKVSTDSVLLFPWRVFKFGGTVRGQRWPLFCSL